jgi:hypothetical protein
MARDEDDDLYDEEFDFVDDDDDEDDDVDDGSSFEEESLADDSDLAEEEPAPQRTSRDRETSERDRGGDAEGDRPERQEGDAAEEPFDEYGRPEQTPANYVVHIYEARKFKRTIDRAFTPEDAEAFASEMNRTSKNYSRVAVTGKNDAKPKKSLDEK